MTLLLRFLIYNLFLSLVAGLLAWLIVLAAVRLLRIRSSSLGFCFYSLPIFKSLLILFGVGLIFPWPKEWFGMWHNQAVSFGWMLPVILIWGVGASLLYGWTVRRTRQAVLQETRLAADANPRLAGIYASVIAEFKKAPCPECGDNLCCPIELKTVPRLLVSERLNTPLALPSDRDPIILFPAGLVAPLSDAELAGALAHELAHFHLRRQNWCSASLLQTLTWIDPVANFTGEYLKRQEEKACDALAVSILGQPETYAGMLMKSYRYAKGHPGKSNIDRLQVLPRLVGFKPLLADRVESLLFEDKTLTTSPLIVWLVWGFLLAILFFNFQMIPS